MNSIIASLFLLSQVVVFSAATTVCGLNQIPSDCLAPYQPTCQRPTPPNYQVLICYWGCTCAPGYILNRPGGQCVSVNRCKCYCGPNQLFSEGGTACPPTCEEPNPGVCPAIAIPGCFCEEGYVLKGNQCVLPCDC